MSYDPEDIDRMSPAVKEELQLRELQLYQYRQRTVPLERRRIHNVSTVRGNGWPRAWAFNHTAAEAAQRRTEHSADLLRRAEAKRVWRAAHGRR